MIIRVSRRQAALIGALLEADLVERGVVEPIDDPPFLVDEPPWVPSEEENIEDEKLYHQIAETLELADRDPPPGVGS